MTYNVRIAITKEDYNKLEKEIHVIPNVYAKMDVIDLVEFGKEKAKQSYDDRVIMLWDYIRWEDSYVEVRFINEFLSKLEDNYDILILDMNDNVIKNVNNLGSFN
jgi:hypothetical protein